MSKMMEYKGYHATFEFDSEDNFFVGKVHGISDSLSFHGTSVGELEAMFHQSIDNYLDMCENTGKIPDKEYSGIFNVRISSALHKKVAEEALRNESTINSIVNVALENYFSVKVKESVVYVPYSLPEQPHQTYAQSTKSTVQEAAIVWHQ